MEMVSVSSPCAACKYLRRKCTQECVFAPYFPPDNPRKFATVHRVFGASNVSKILNELSATDRDDAVRSLAYEADYRLRDPVYGCVGHISILQQRLQDMRGLLLNAKKELATYIGPQAMLPILQPTDFFGQQQPYGMMPQQQGPSGMLWQHPPGMAPQQQGPSGTIRQEHPVIMLPEEQYRGSQSTPMFGYNNMASPAKGAQARTPDEIQLMIHETQQSQQHNQESRQPIFESQQLADTIAEREQEMMGYEQQKQMQLEFWRANSKFNLGSGSGDEFNDMSDVAGAGTGTEAEVSPSLALGTYDVNPYHFPPQQPEQQPPPDSHLQYLAQEAEQHHSLDPCHQFQLQQPEQHHPPDSYHQFLPQKPMQHHSPDPYRQFLPQQPEQHHFPDSYHQFLPQQPEQYHHPDPYHHQFLPQHQHRPNPDELQTQQPPQPLQQSPQLQQLQQLRPNGEDKDSSVCPP